MENQRMQLFDRIILGADQTLRTLYGVPHGSGRISPAHGQPDEPLVDESKNLSIRLMRINHAGEVAAQALYQGQAMVTHNHDIRNRMHNAATEENDHLIWCRERLEELGGKPSALDFFWYGGAFVIGSIAGIKGDQFSLGFIEETERQVVQHLHKHLKKLPINDQRSRAVLTTMRRDEARHGANAHAAGGKRPPAPIRIAMRAAAKVMTQTSYWI